LGLVGADPFKLPFDANSQLPLLLWILAVLTMTLGNMLALLQDNIRRMLAYSSVAHAGYMLIGIIVACSYPDLQSSSKNGFLGMNFIGATAGGVSALLVYLVAYGMMTVGAFAVILALSTPERPIESIDDLAGIGQSHPISARSMTIFMFSLIGMPLTAGFVGKGLLFLGAIGAPSGTPVMRNLYQVLAVLMAVNAGIAAIYYLRVIGAMYLRTPLRPVIGSRAKPTLLAVVVLAAATLYFGCYPEPIWRAAQKAVPLPQISSQVPARGP
jgi:NADH-quinone oxidoreductase subunit N